ncbi:MAG: sialidase family protein, partial [Nanoarchaeota archaeon]
YLFSNDYYITSIVEADDGSLVFRDLIGGNPGSVYRYSNGIVTKTFTDGPAPVDFNAGLLKASDEAIYFISTDTSADINLVDYTQSGTAFLAAYKSTDNGMTWNKLGVLPNSWDIKGKIVEAADGTLYVTSFSPCYGGYTIYKSADKGATWSIIAAPPRDFTRGRIEYYYEYHIYSLAEVAGKVLIVGNAPVIFNSP